MRRDMGKIITERERHGSSNPSMKYRQSIRWQGFDADYEGPKRAKASSQGQYGFNHKEFTDVLGPIYRFLRSQVGRPWNKIYGEMCAVLDKRKVTHKHVFDHAMQYVERDRVYKGTDGLFYVKGRYTWKANDVPINGLFVDPRTGILRSQKVKEKAGPKKPVDEIKRPDGKYYKKILGIWYLCDIKKLDPWEVVGMRPSKYDYLPAEKIYRKDLKSIPHEIVENKRQLGKRELKELGLKNE